MSSSSSGLPRVRVRLVGEDGNAFAIIGRMTRAMRRAGWPLEAIEEWIADATAGDYEHLLGAVLRVTDDELEDPELVV